MNKQERIKEYIRKIASDNGLSYEDVENIAIVKLIIEYIVNDEEIEGE
jgi:hypothetical protein